MNYTVYTLNCTGTSSIQGKSPFELWYNRIPSIENLHIFGEDVYAHIPSAKRRKLDPKAKKGTFLGYDNQVKGYRIWIPEEN